METFEELMTAAIDRLLAMNDAELSALDTTLLAAALEPPWCHGAESTPELHMIADLGAAMTALSLQVDVQGTLYRNLVLALAEGVQADALQQHLLAQQPSVVRSVLEAWKHKLLVVPADV